MDEETIALMLLSLLFGGVTGALLLWGFIRIKIGHYRKVGEDLVAKARQETEISNRDSELAFRHHLADQQKEFDLSCQQERRKLHKEEERLKQKEDKLESRQTLLEKKLLDLEKREGSLNSALKELEKERQDIQERQTSLLQQLEQASGLSAIEARELILERLTHDVQREAANQARKIVKEAEEHAEQDAKRIIIGAIQRLAVPCTSEVTTQTVPLPSDELKGRIIGREGRNIRALEQATGVNFVIDETPGAIVLSGFDPVRLYIAKCSLQQLLHDGRIHPSRIEEIVDQTKQDTDKQLKRWGEEAALRAGAMGLAPEIVMLLGKLKLRYSFGQNILDHSLEVSHLMGILAAEVGLDIALSKRIGLLHDIGKAVSHEYSGSHAIIGQDLVLKYGEHPKVANGVGCHHFEVEANSFEAALCSAADAMSAARLGARIEAVEEYVKRLGKLEEIAAQFEGVEKVYAMQAGRELRVFVQPDWIDDEAMRVLGKELTKKIEQEANYPSKIRITLIRERRLVQYAL